MNIEYALGKRPDAIGRSIYKQELFISDGQ